MFLCVRRGCTCSSDVCRTEEGSEKLTEAIGKSPSTPLAESCRRFLRHHQNIYSQNNNVNSEFRNLTRLKGFSEKIDGALRKAGLTPSVLAIAQTELEVAEGLFCRQRCALNGHMTVQGFLRDQHVLSIKQRVKASTCTPVAATLHLIADPMRVIVIIRMSNPAFIFCAGDIAKKSDFQEKGWCTMPALSIEEQRTMNHLPCITLNMSHSGSRPTSSHREQSSQPYAVFISDISHYISSVKRWTRTPLTWSLMSPEMP